MKPSMKCLLILTAGLALVTASVQAETNAPKNLARQHLGANLLVFNPASNAYEPTEAAAAWLDDDVATGWPALTGRQDYLLVLPEPALLGRFSISARSATGTVTLYTGDENAAPGAKTWTLVAKDIPIESINEKNGKQIGRFGKYLLMETNLTESGPWYSIYLYNQSPAASYTIQTRAQPVDPRTIFGPYTNPETSFSVSSLYAHAKIIAAGGDSASWQNAIDDNPETGTYVSATQSEAGLAMQFDRSYAIERISVLTDPGTKGKLEIFVANPPATTGSDASATDLTSQSPVATLNFDGTSPRASADFTAASGTRLMARWTPDTAGQPINVREINSFGDVALNDYELSPSAVAEGPGDSSKDSTDPKGDGKTALPGVGEGPGNPSPIGEGAPGKTAFVPGVPVFPPTIPFSP
jgi:hypothetical protein